MNSIRIIIFVLLFVIRASAETIIGNCFIQDKPFGESQFQLNPGTIVDCSAPQKGWCMILFKAYIEKKYVYDGIKIFHNARIMNEHGKHTGKVLIDMNPYRTILENDTCYIMEIAGYVEVMCIEDTSIVEHELEKIFQRTDSLISISYFNKHLHDFHYKQWITKEAYFSFLLPETDIVNPRPGLRVIIIFERNQAVAILHRRPIRIRKYESLTATSAYRIVYLSNFDEKYKKKIADIFLGEAGNL